MFTILVFSGDTSNFNLSSIHAVTASFVLTASSFVLQKILKSSAYRIENYLLDQTWYKPRDIIRLFSIIQKQHGQKSFFDQEIFDSVRKTYAEESWIEFEEVLTAKYSDAEVEGIKKSLTSLALPDKPRYHQHIHEQSSRRSSRHAEPWHVPLRLLLLQSYLYYG